MKEWTSVRIQTERETHAYTPINIRSRSINLIVMDNFFETHDNGDMSWVKNAETRISKKRKKVIFEDISKKRDQFLMDDMKSHNWIKSSSKTRHQCEFFLNERLILKSWFFTKMKKSWRVIFGRFYEFSFKETFSCENFWFQREKQMKKENFTKEKQLRI